MKKTRINTVVGSENGADCSYLLPDLLNIIQERVVGLKEAIYTRRSKLQNEIEIIYTFACQAENLAGDLALSYDGTAIRARWFELLTICRRVSVCLAGIIRRIMNLHSENWTTLNPLLEKLVQHIDLGHKICFQLHPSCDSDAMFLQNTQGYIQPGYPEMGLYYGVSIVDLIEAANELIDSTDINSEAILVVGIRKSGSFAAPIYVATLEEIRGRQVPYMTVRPMCKTKHISSFTLPWYHIFDFKKASYNEQPIGVCTEDELKLVRGSKDLLATKALMVLLIDDHPCSGGTFRQVEDYLIERINCPRIIRIKLGTQSAAKCEYKPDADWIDSYGSEVAAKPIVPPLEDQVIQEVVPLLEWELQNGNYKVTGITPTQSMPDRCQGVEHSTLHREIIKQWRSRFPLRTWRVELEEDVTPSPRKKRIIFKHVGLPGVAEMEACRIRMLDNFSPTLLARWDSYLIFRDLGKYKSLPEFKGVLSPEALEKMASYLCTCVMMNKIRDIPIDEIFFRSTEAIQYICKILSVNPHEYLIGIKKSLDLNRDSTFLALQMGGDILPYHWLISENGKDARRCHLDVGNSPCVVDVAEEFFLLSFFLNRSEINKIARFYENITGDQTIARRGLLLAPISLMRLYMRELLGYHSLLNALRGDSLNSIARHGQDLKNTMQGKLRNWLTVLGDIS